MPRRISFALLLSVLFSVYTSAQVTLFGVGSTFVYPIFSKWEQVYQKQHPDVRIGYLPIGSGAGIAQTLTGTVDFGGTDAPVDDTELNQSKIKILHVPVILGADVPAYNLPDVETPIRFTGQLLADIFLGKVRNWNDPAIAAVNQGARFPNREITVVHRLDGSGTTYIWTDYLSKINSEWKGKVGKGTRVKWPAGVEANGNEGVSEKIREVNGAIGYVELSYAQQKKIAFGSVQNAAGRFMVASVASIEEAAGSSALPPSDFRTSITNAPGANAYPIAGFSWILVPVQAKSPEAKKALRDFLSWAITDGQRYAPDLFYCPLPPEIATRARQLINDHR